MSDAIGMCSITEYFRPNQPSLSLQCSDHVSPSYGSLLINPTENYFLKYFIDYSDTTIVDMDLNKILNSSCKDKLLNFTHLYKFACMYVMCKYHFCLL